MVSKEPGYSFPGKEEANSQEHKHNYWEQSYAGKPPFTPVQETAHFDALEVPYTASFEEIKMSYKKLVKKYHPDKFHNDPQKRQYAETVTQKLNEAYTYFEKKYEAGKKY